MDNANITNLTPEYIESLIVRKDFHAYNSVNEQGETVATLTTCILTVKNGTLIYGNTVCQLSTLYNQEEEEAITYDNAINKLLDFELYLLKEREYLKSIKIEPAVEEIVTDIKESFMQKLLNV